MPVEGPTAAAATKVGWFCNQGVLDKRRQIVTNKRRHDDDEDDYEDDPPEVRPVRRPRQRDLGDDPAMRLLLPVGLSGWAIASGYLGLISVLCIPSPLALITGILALREMSRNPKKHGMGRAIFGIVMGGLGTVSMVILAVLFVTGTLTKR
jgi:hypothetical protein